MLISKPVMTEDQKAEVQKLTDSKKRNLEERERSFRDSDTDGFLSQWASGITADLAQANINVLMNGGHAEFPVLVYEGEVIADRVYSFNNNFGGCNRSFLVKDKNLQEKFGRKWIPAGDTSRVQKKLGITQETRWFPAKAVTKSNGKGLSGRVWVETVRIFDEKE